MTILKPISFVEAFPQINDNNLICYTTLSLKLWGERVVVGKPCMLHFMSTAKLHDFKILTLYIILANLLQLAPHI